MFPGFQQPFGGQFGQPQMSPFGQPQMSTVGQPVVISSQPATSTSSSRVIKSSSSKVVNPSSSGTVVGRSSAASIKGATPVSSAASASSRVSATSSAGVRIVSSSSQQNASPAPAKPSGPIRMSTTKPSSTLQKAAASGDLDKIMAASDAALKAERLLVYFAAKNNHAKIINYFSSELADCVDVDEHTHDGMTPLMVAALEGHCEAVAALIDAGCTVRTKCDNRTALDMAKEKGNVKITSTILHHFLERELSDIVGLQSVKDQLRDMLKAHRVKLQREAAGVKVKTERSRHMAFLGNPGTGKTMLARLVGQLLYMLGVTKNDAYVEASRDQLCGEYVGASAQLTAKRISEARGGVMFVDEAYRLTDKGGMDYGIEALETMIVEMTREEDDQVLFLFAGYDQRMQRFFNANPGMDRRVPYRFRFKDYTTNELAEMMMKKLSKCGYKTACSIEDMAEIFDKYIHAHFRSQYNGGLVDRIVQEAETVLTRRISVDETDPEVLVTIIRDDLAVAASTIQQRLVEQDEERAKARAQGQRYTVMRPDY